MCLFCICLAVSSCLSICLSACFSASLFVSVWVYACVRVCRCVSLCFLLRLCATAGVCLCHCALVSLCVCRSVSLHTCLYVCGCIADNMYACFLFACVCVSPTVSVSVWPTPALGIRCLTGCVFFVKVWGDRQWWLAVRNVLMDPIASNKCENTHG